MRHSALQLDGAREGYIASQPLATRAPLPSNATALSSFSSDSDVPSPERTLINATSHSLTDQDHLTNSLADYLSNSPAKHQHTPLLIMQALPRRISHFWRAADPCCTIATTAPCHEHSRALEPSACLCAYCANSDSFRTDA